MSSASIEELSELFAKYQSHIAYLTEGLTDAEIVSAYEAYWRKNHTTFVPFFEDGHITPERFTEMQLEWLRTLDLSILLQIVSKHDIGRPCRPWIADDSTVEFTYIESVRVNLSDTLNTYAGLRDVEDSLAAARNGLAFAGMMLGDGGTDPISPNWVALSSGGLRPNGRAAGAGYPSHRILDLPEALDVGARDGRNRLGWDTTVPNGLTTPCNNLYVGSLREKYFEMSRMAGDISAMDLSSDGRTAALIENWGGSTWRIAIADLESGERRYLRAPKKKFTGLETIQFSPGNDWILVAGYRRWKALLVRSDTGEAIRLPLGRAMTAAWWPSQGASAIAVLLDDDDGTQLACFDCETAQLRPIGPIRCVDSDLTGDQRHCSELVVHPFKNIALVGTDDRPSNTSRSPNGSRYRVAHLDLDRRETLPLVDPFVGGDDRFERCHSSGRWVIPPKATTVFMHDELMASSKSHVCDEPEDTEYTGGNAAEIAFHASEALLDRMEDVHRLRPELLRAFEACRRYGSRKDLDVTDRLRELQKVAHRVVGDLRTEWGLDPQQWPSSGPGVTTLARGLDLVISGRSQEIDWSADRNQ